MKRRRHPLRSRRGAVLVESAIVLTVTVLLFLGTITLALGLFRRNQVAYLAHRGARWASVRGPTYQADQKASAPTAADVMTNVVTPRMGAAANTLTSSLTWNTGADPKTVTFTLNYRWAPGSLFSTRTFTSTSTQPISY